MEATASYITSIQSFQTAEINTTIMAPFQSVRSPAETVIEVTLAVICTLLAAAGNTFIVFAIRTEAWLRNNTNKVIESLAWTDIINAFLVLPFFCLSLAKGKWMLGEEFCSIDAFLLALTTLATLDTLTVLAINRLLKIVFPNAYSKVFGSAKKTNIILAVVWIMSAITSGAPFVGWGGFAYIQVFHVCTLEWHPKHNSYLVFYNVVSTYPATAIVIICYIWIYVHHHYSARRLILHANKGDIPNNQLLRAQQLADLRVLKMTAAVMGFYLICWFPVALLLNLRQRGVVIPPRVAILPPFLKFVNSCGNPIFYVILDRRFRKTFLRLVNCCTCGFQAVSAE